MGNNSVYAVLNTDSVINEVRLTLSAKPETPFIIVEGKDDIDFFRLHCPHKVIIRESFNGKIGVLQVLEVFTDKESVIGICDRDYDSTPLPTHMFYYDYSCLETMLFSNNKTSEVVFTQLELKCKVSLIEILSQLFLLSYLRKMSYINNLAIRFDGLSISKVFDCNCGIERDKLITELQRINNNLLLISDELKVSIEISANSFHTINDLLLITQGHDLISLIQCYHSYHVSFKGKTMSEGDIRALIYCTYVEKFNTSRLYNDVLQYGQEINIVFWAA